MVRMLLTAGVPAAARNTMGQTAAQLTKRESIKMLLLDRMPASLDRMPASLDRMHSAVGSHAVTPKPLPVSVSEEVTVDAAVDSHAVTPNPVPLSVSEEVTVDAILTLLRPQPDSTVKSTFTLA